MPRPSTPTLTPYADQLPDVNSPSTWAARTPLFWNWVTGPGFNNFDDFLTYSEDAIDYIDAALAGSETVVDAVGVIQGKIAGNLDALSGINANGIYARTGAGTAAARTITGTEGVIAVTNGNGVSGNPTISATKATTGQAEAGTGAGLMDPVLTAAAIAAQVPPLITPVNTSTVLSATAGATFGAVGTYAFASFASNSRVIEGDTYAGSALRVAGFRASSPQTPDDSFANTSTVGGTLSGTWRAMGRQNSGTGGVTYLQITLFLRIS